MDGKNQVSRIIFQLCSKVYKLNRRSLNGFVNHLEKAHLVFGSHDKACEALKKILAQRIGE